MSKARKIFYIISSIIVVLFIILCVMIHSLPRTNPAPLYYFVLPMMCAKLFMAYQYVLIGEDRARRARSFDMQQWCKDNPIKL